MMSREDPPDSPKMSGTKTPRGVRTRARLLAEARALFAERGWDGTTTKQIARRAGVTEPTLYRHFEGKAALLLEVVKTTLLDLRRQSEGVVARMEPGGLAATLVASGFASDRTERRIIVEAYAAAGRNPDLARAMTEWNAQTAAWFASALQDAGHEGATELAWLLLVIGTGMAAADTLTPIPITSESWQRSVTDRLRRLLAPDPDAAFGSS